MAIIICLLLVAYNNFTRLSQANAWDNHTLQVLLAGDQVEQAADHIQGAYLAFLIGGSESGLADLEKTGVNWSSGSRKPSASQRITPASRRG